MYSAFKKDFSPGILISLDFPYAVYGTKFGLELGWLSDLQVATKYKTLNGLGKKEVVASQSNVFANIRLAKYFEYFLLPYIGVAWGASNSKLSKYPMLFTGINSKNIFNIPLNFSMEIRTLSLNVDSKEVKFNNFGRGKLTSKSIQYNGYAASLSLNYQF